MSRYVAIILALLCVGCARVRLVLVNQGTDAMENVRVRLLEQEMAVSYLSPGDSEEKAFKINAISSPRIEYSKSGQKVWASAAVEFKPGDRGKVVLERFTKAGSEEFRVLDRRPQARKSK